MKPMGNEKTGSPVQVVCLGGGWVALGLARSLQSAIRSGDVALTVVSRDNYQTIHGLISEMLTGKVDPQNLISPIRRMLGLAQLHNAEATGIDTLQQTVTTCGPNGETHCLPYDHLVLGIGSTDRPELTSDDAPIFALKTFEECLRLRSHLVATLERAAIETDPETRRRLLTFVVAGGNYAGIEVASDLRDYFKLLVRTDFPQIRPDEFRVIVLEIGPQILSELASRYPRLVAYAERRIAQLGIEVRRNTGMKSAASEFALTTDGESIPTATIIRCIGTGIAPLVANFPANHDMRGRIVTDRCLRVQGKGEWRGNKGGVEGNEKSKVATIPLDSPFIPLSFPHNVWAAGDCAAVPHPKGGTCPPLALYARAGGQLIGVNLLRMLKNKPLKPYRFDGLGEACSLGHGCAIAQMKGVPAFGRFAWIGWRLIILALIVPDWSRRIRLLFDWLVTPFTGRNIVALHEHQAAEKKGAKRSGLRQAII